MKNSIYLLLIITLFSCSTSPTNKKLSKKVAIKQIDAYQGVYYNTKSVDFDKQYLKVNKMVEHGYSSWTKAGAYFRIEHKGMGYITVAEGTQDYPERLVIKIRDHEI